MGERVMQMTAGKRAARKQDRRQAIVDAAKASFLETGYAATSMSGLLSVLGGSKATLWSYFPSKEELFAAVIIDLTASFREETERALLPHGDLEPTLLQFCRTFMAAIAAPESLATWRLVVAESGRFPEVGRIFYEQAASQLQSALSDFLSRKIANRELAGAEPAEMADMLISMCLSLQSIMLWGVAQVDQTDIAARAELYVATFLRAFAPVPMPSDGRAS